MKTKEQDKDPTKEKRIQELEVGVRETRLNQQEQVRDLQFFIEAQKQLADDTKLADGQVIKLQTSAPASQAVQPTAPPTSPVARGKRTPKKGRNKGKGRK